VLFVLFSIGPQRYALPAYIIQEIIPIVERRVLPQAPDYVAGLIRYRGRVVPVIDLSRMAGFPAAAQVLSTRIILVDYPHGSGESQILGLMVEHVTGTAGISTKELVSPGVTIPQAPYLGKLFNHSGEMIQTVHLDDLLTRDVKDILFTRDS
jgi:chemotaxis-related protein WspB